MTNPKKTIKIKSFIESEIPLHKPGLEPESPEWLVIKQKLVPVLNNIDGIFTKMILDKINF